VLMNSRITILLRHHFPCSSKFQIFTIGLSCNGVAPPGNFPAHVSCWKHSTWLTEFGKQRLTKPEVNWSSVLMSSNIHSLLGTLIFPCSSNSRYFKLGYPEIFLLHKSLQLMHCASVIDKNHIYYQKKIVKLGICALKFEHS
jgi:hypothetical protein